jgi:hypothetical protein
MPLFEPGNDYIRKPEGLARVVEIDQILATRENYLALDRANDNFTVGRGFLVQYWTELFTPLWHPPVVALAAMFDNLMAHPPRDMTEVLIRAESAVALLEGCSTSEIGTIVYARKHKFDTLGNWLVRASTLPVARGSSYATQMAALLAPFTLSHVERIATQQSTGIRTVRILERVLRLIHENYNANITEAESPRYLLWWSRGLKDELNTVNEILKAISADTCANLDFNPARGVVIDALRQAPFDTSWKQKGPQMQSELGDWDWVDERLQAIAGNMAKPWRARAQAVAALLERGTTADQIDKLLNETDESVPGLEYARLVTLHSAQLFRDHYAQRRAMRQGEAPDLHDGWPTSSPWWPEKTPMSKVAAILDELETKAKRPHESESVSSAYGLVRLALFSIDGSSRRLAGEALAAAGLDEVVQSVCDRIVTSDDFEWIKELACVLMGFMRGSRIVLSSLAYVLKSSPSELTRQAALVALADLQVLSYQIPDSPDFAITVDNLKTLVSSESSEIRHAAGYFIACFRPASLGVSTAVEMELFELLEKSPDEIMRSLHVWGKQLRAGWL